MKDQASLDNLVEMAKDEGQVVWYTSIPSERAEQIGDMFSDKYGIEAVVQRSGGADILQKFLLEEQAGRVQNDVLTVSDPAAFINLKQDDALKCFTPRNFDAVPAYAKDEDGCWIATRINAYVIAYNTRQVDDPPSGFQDLVDARFDGDLAYVNPNFSSGALIVTAGLANDLGWDWFEKLASTDPFVVKGNNDTMQTVVTGQRGVATFVNSTYVAQAKAEGQPVEWVFPEDGVYLIPAPSAVVEGGPNPAAGKLLANFLLTKEVQQLMVDDGNYAAVETLPSPDGQPSVDEMTRLEVDFDKLAETANDVRDRFNSIVQSAN
ncbi:MAG TPA: extracellular solute-binding protein [Nocardioidaceae bacterium]|nr:extracellular solute-binding protein [Nocardioidaceae bacterium]